MTRRRGVTLSSTRPGRIIQDDRLGVCGDPDQKHPRHSYLFPAFVRRLAGPSALGIWGIWRAWVAPVAFG